MQHHGSLTNRINEYRLSPEPEVGMGATIYKYSDRHAATVVRIEHYKSSGKVKAVFVQEDTAELVGGKMLSESQQYAFTPNPNGRIHECRKRRDGTWRGYQYGFTADGIVFGERSEYRDPTF